MAEELHFNAPEPLNDLLAKYVHITVDETDIDDETVRHTLLLKASEEASDLLATEGYFSPVLRWQDRYSIEVIPGLRTKVSEVKLDMIGPITTPQKEHFLASWLLPAGQFFTQEKWTIAKQEILRDISDIDFPSAQIIRSEARIDKNSNTAMLYITIHTGPKHVYGDIIFNGLSRYKDELIRTYTDIIKPGARYHRADLLRLQSSLQNTPYFSAINVQTKTRRAADTSSAHSADVSDNTDAVNTTAQPNEQDPLAEVTNTPPLTDISSSPSDDPAVSDNAEVVTTDLLVTVVERAQHRISFGLGASSNNGARAQVSYLYPDLFGYAWDFYTGFKYEQNKQQLFSDIFFPRKQTDMQYSVGAVFERENVNNLPLQNQTYRATQAYTIDRSERKISLTLERSTQERSAQEDEQLGDLQKVALVPGITYTWRMVDSLVRPRFGGNYYVDLSGASEEFISDTSFLYINARAQYFYSFGDSLTLITRAEIGANIADNVDSVPERYLFRTGGSNSIRGFDYLRIGVVEDEVVSGANRLAVASAELNYWFDDSWAGAIFFDTGNAQNEMKKPNFDFYGYGIGIRYATPAGPFALDVAQGNVDNSIHLHFSVSIPF